MEENEKNSERRRERGRKQRRERGAKTPGAGAEGGQGGLYPASLEAKIGFDGVRRMLRERCTSAPGRGHVDAMEWTADYERVKALLEETQEMVNIETGSQTLSLGDIADCTEWLLPARIAGSFIDVAELGVLRTTLATVQDIRAFFARQGRDEDGASAYQRLGAVASGLDDAPEVRQAIDKVLDRNGEVKDNASAELREIRMQLSTIAMRASAAMRRVLATGVREGYLEPDTTPSMRDGRLVIPVSRMHKRRIAGIVNDESASGKTYFIEPAEVVELNNRQRELELDERREIVRILIGVADVIRPQIDSLAETFAVLGRLDFIRAKARLAIDTRASLPHVQEEPELEWYTARHPVLQASLESQGREIVPLEIRLDRERRILVISGPNAGGKSVTLKTVGIVQYMMQCGLLPTLYENSRMGMMDGIFADIGDDQSMEDDLSTYSSHLRNMRAFLSRGNSRTLMLIDEFGSGTEPQIGGAIAQALLAQFNAKGMWGVITTHYQNLKTMADDTPGLVNGSMLYDRQRMEPLFKLSIGHPGSSFAIEIARKTGLPESIIAAAEEIVGSDYVNLDKYVLDITRDKRYWENKRQQVRQREKHLEEVIEKYEANAEELRHSRRVIIDEARRQAEEIIAGSNADVERAIHDIRKSQADKEATAEARRRLAERRKELSEPADKGGDDPEILKRAPRPKKPRRQPEAKEERPIAAGDNVLLDKGGQPGTVMETDGKKATVAFGALKMTVPVERLTPTVRKAAQPMKASSFVSAATTNQMRDRQLNFNTEIDLRGMRADEAVQAVTYFIDDALQFAIGRVRILHGTGTGALRQVVRQYLDTVPGVKSYHDEDVRFGGAGITVVNL